MKDVTAGTVARTIVLILALANMALTFMGKNPIDISEDTIYEACTILATIATALIAWWKNNSFSKAAIAGDEAKSRVKLGIENVDAEMGEDQPEAEDDGGNGYVKEAE